MKSCFKPVSHSEYQIVWFQRERKVNTIPKTPSPMQRSIESSDDKIHQMKKPEMIKVESIHKIKKRKNWTSEERSFAIQKGLFMGIAKALRMLHSQYPLIYSDLSPSTLQYWVAKSKTIFTN